jgi:hypothetical protein
MVLFNTKFVTDYPDFLRKHMAHEIDAIHDLIILSLDTFLQRDHFLKIGCSDLNSCPKCSIIFVRITSWSLWIWLQIYIVFFLGLPFTVDEREVSKGGFHIKWSQSKKPGLYSSCKNYSLILMHNMLYQPISEAIRLVVAADEVKRVESMTFHDQPWCSVKVKSHVNVW